VQCRAYPGIFVCLTGDFLGFFWHVLMHVALIYMKEEVPVEVMLIHFAVPMSLQGVTLGSKTIKNGFLILGTFFIVTC